MKLFDGTQEVKNRLMIELFSKTAEDALKMLDLTLPRNAGKTLAKSKVASLSKK